MVFIAAEIGINHNGDLKIAKKLIDSSGLNVLSATAFQEAADKVQEAIN